MNEKIQLTYLVCNFVFGNFFLNSAHFPLLIGPQTWTINLSKDCEEVISKVVWYAAKKRINWHTKRWIKWLAGKQKDKFYLISSDLSLSHGFLPSYFSWFILSHTAITHFELFKRSTDHAHQNIIFIVLMLREIYHTSLRYLFAERERERKKKKEQINID